MFKKAKITKSSIKKKTEGALSMFKTAIDSLEEATLEAEALKETNQDVIRELKEENKEIEKELSKNNKVISNFKNLIFQS